MFESFTGRKQQSEAGPRPKEAENEPRKTRFLDVPSGIAMDLEFRISGGCERKTGAIDLMKDPVPHAQPRVKTGLSATAAGRFGLDTGLFMSPVPTMRLIAKKKAR